MNKRLKKKLLKQAYYGYFIVNKLYKSEDMNIILSNKNIADGMELTPVQWDGIKMQLHSYVDCIYLTPSARIYKFLYNKDIKCDYRSFINLKMEEYFKCGPPKIKTNEYLQFKNWYTKMVYVQASLSYRARQIAIRAVPSPSLIDRVLKTEDYQKALNENTLGEFFDSITDWRYKYL